MDDEMIERVRARIQATDLGSVVEYYTSMKLDDDIERVRVVGKLKEKYFLPEFITVVPERIMILEKGKETPYQGELPRTIDSNVEKMNGYRVLRKE